MKEKNRKTQMAIDEEEIDEEDIIRDEDEDDDEDIEEEQEQEPKKKVKSSKSEQPAPAMTAEQMHQILLNHEQRITQIESWIFRIKSQ